MKLVSFNLFRTLGLKPSEDVTVTYVKPETYAARPQDYEQLLTEADWVLFPEYWQLNALEYGLGCRVFPSPASYRLGHDKIEMTRIFQLVAPEHHPRTWIAQNSATEAERLWEAMSYPFVAKLPKASQGTGVWLIEQRQQWLDYLGIADRLYVQEYLPIDKDLRIVIVGNEIIAAYWRHQSEYSFHTNVAQGGFVSYDDIPPQAIDFVTKLARGLNIDHAGFDIAMVGDHPYLLEFNRLFGNQGIPGGGKDITEAILRYLDSHTDDDGPIDPIHPGSGPPPVQAA